MSLQKELSLSIKIMRQLEQEVSSLYNKVNTVYDRMPYKNLDADNAFGKFAEVCILLRLALQELEKELEGLERREG